MSALQFYFKFIISFLCVNCVLSAGVGNPGLYTPQDNVDILTVDNFNETIFGSEKPWIVEFYSSWCGFCQRFAPHWKAFAAEVKNWRDVVGIGVIDCANQINSPVCFDMIVTSYPTLRYFHANYEHGPGNIGEKMLLGNQTAHHKRHLIDALIKDQAGGNSSIKPNLQVFEQPDFSEVFKSTPESTKYVVMIVQQPLDTIGAEIAMDLHKIEGIVVRYTYSNNTHLINYLEPIELPAMYTIERNYQMSYFYGFKPDRENLEKKLIKYLAAQSINIPVELINKFDNQSTTEEESENTAAPDEYSEQIKKMGDIVLQGDLETALRYSLRNEIGLRREITGDQLVALKNYINVLVQYFPFGTNGKSFLKTIKSYINSTDPINGANILNMIEQSDKPAQKIFSSRNQWLACKGSRPFTRGYPCGLWMLFHYLTVNAAIERSDSNARVILEAIQGYVKNFFTCVDCRNHFLEMAERRELTKVDSLDNAVLWLWEAHNEVNQRLAGDITEDPAYPKKQFPTKDHCTQCYDVSGSWNKQQVLEYLKNMYGKENIQYLGSDKDILQLTGEDINLATTISTNGILIAFGIASCYIWHL